MLAVIVPALQLSASAFNMSLKHALQVGSAAGRRACPLMTLPPSQAFKANTCLSETPTRQSNTLTSLSHDLIKAGSNQHVSALATLMATEVIQSGLSPYLTFLWPACSAQTFPWPSPRKPKGQSMHCRPIWGPAQTPRRLMLASACHPSWSAPRTAWYPHPSHPTPRKPRRTRASMTDISTAATIRSMLKHTET